jgi:hypothetical protein
MPPCLRVTSVIGLWCLSAIASDPYAFLWWAHGWRGLSPDGQKILHIQTSQYGAAFDVERLAVPHLGPLPSAAPYSEAVSQSNDTVASLPPALLHLTASVNGLSYECTSAASGQDAKPNFSRAYYRERPLSGNDLTFSTSLLPPLTAAPLMPTPALKSLPGPTAYTSFVKSPQKTTGPRRHLPSGFAREIVSWKTSVNGCPAAPARLLPYRSAGHPVPTL